MLNALLIPRFGYIAAAYTTLVSFMWLALAHMFLVQKIGYAEVYNRKLIMLILLGMSAYTVAVNFLYSAPVLRYCLLAVYIAAFCFLVWKYRAVVQMLLKRKKK